MLRYFEGQTIFMVLLWDKIVSLYAVQRKSLFSGASLIIFQDLKTLVFMVNIFARFLLVILYLKYFMFFDLFIFNFF